MKFLYQFSAGQSFLHSVDPRSKMLFLVAFLIVLWVLPMPWPMIMAGSMLVVIWVAAGIKPNEYSAFLLFMLPIMFAVCLIQLLSAGGPYYNVAIGGVGLPLSIKGLDTGLRVAFRLAAMGIVFMSFSATTDPFHWGMALYKSGLPYKTAFMFGFAMRFFPLLQEELAIISNALRARASENVGSRNPVKIVRAVGQIVIPMGLSSLRRSQTIALAMELRGYRLPDELKTGRTLYRKIGFSWRDGVVWAVALALLAGMIVSIVL